MRVSVKICGLTSVAAIEAAADAGVDAVGFVFAASPRRVTLRTAAELVPRVPAGIGRVAVFGAAVDPQLTSLLEDLGLQVLQADAAACRALHGRTRLTLWPVFHDGPNVELEVLAYHRALDRERDASARPFLFEGAVSGRGVRPDWDRAARLAACGQMSLAGGLTPQNVGAAIAAVRPAMVDVSSGVESAPGDKDPRRIAAFVAAVRAAEERCSC